MNKQNTKTQIKYTLIKMPYNIKNVGKVESWVINKNLNDNGFTDFNDDNAIIKKETDKAILVSMAVTSDDFYLADANNKDQRFHVWDFWIPKSQINK